jgi:predicted dehydrogenase
MVNSQKKLLRVGIIGCGDIFSSHALAYPESSHVVVVGFYDRIRSRAEGWCNQFKKYMAMIKESAETNDTPEDQWDLHRCELFEKEVCIYSTVSDLIENVDLIDICAPNYAHAPYAIWALKKNKHVVTEKPPARCSLETKWILEAAKNSQGKYQLNENMLWQVYVREMARLLKENRIGELTHLYISLGHGGPSWGWNNHFMNPTLSGGGVLIDMGMHAIGIAFGIIGPDYKVSKIQTLEMNCGTKPERTLIDSEGGNEYLMHKFMVEDDARVDITLKNQKTQKEILFHLETSWSRTMQEIRVEGTEGLLKLDTDEKHRRIISHITYNEDNEENITQILIPPQGRDSHQIELIDFIDRITSGKTPYLDAEWAHQMMEIISGAYLANILQKPVTIPDLWHFYQEVIDRGCPESILIEEIIYSFMKPFMD